MFAQVLAFSERIEREGITDPEQLDLFNKMCKQLTREKERVGQAKPKSKDNGFPDDEMDDFEFLDNYYGGNDEFRRVQEERFEAGYGCPFHARLVLLPDTVWMDYEARKPRLMIPNVKLFLPEED